MTDQTGGPSTGNGNGHSRGSGRWWRWLWRALVAVGIAGISLIGVGVILGWYAPASLGILAFLLAGGGLAIGWMILVVAALRRSPSRRRWLVRLTVATACWGGLTVGFYLACWRPMRTVHDFDFMTTATPAEIRSLCHWSLLYTPEPHDQFIDLIDIGDESSVPYIIWALRWMPTTEGYGACTWDHGLKALRTITNNSVGTTRKAWGQWYAVNKHRSQLEWWADGFTAEGYAVSATGEEESIRNLLSALGRTPWGRPEQKEYLSINARRMLASFDKAKVQVVMAQVGERGTVEQKRGLAHYAGGLDRAESEPILLALLRDEDRSVRLWASAAICYCQKTWLKNPGRFILKRYEPGEVNADEFFAPAGEDVVAAKMGSERRWTLDNTTEWQVKVVPGTAEPGEAERPDCIIRIDYEGTGYDRPAVLSLEGRLPRSDREVYSTQLVISTSSTLDELHWLFNADTDRLYVSAPGFTCLADPGTGNVLWEMGFGTGNCDDLFLLKDYLVIRENGDLVVCDAARGGILAYYDLQGELFGDRLSLVEGRLRAIDFDDRLYIIELPELPSATPAAEEKPAARATR